MDSPQKYVRQEFNTGEVDIFDHFNNDDSGWDYLNPHSIC